MNGHDHTYERFAPQDPSGVADSERGIREFVVGTGSAGLYSFGTPEPNSEVRESNTHGVLKLTLLSTGYTWEFIPIAGQTFTDSGSASCVPSPPMASFTYSCTDLTCDFDASGSSDPDGTVVSYDWDFGDGNSGSGVTVQHTYTAAGTYTVVLTVTDDGGLTGSDIQSVPVGVSPVHVGDLDGSSASAPRNRWDATVNITVHDQNHNVVADATVEGSWSNGANGSGSCTTDISGRCSITKSNVKGDAGSVTFTVDTVTHGADPYGSGDNHDPDGDSDGTSIVVYKDGPPANQPPAASFAYSCTDLTCDFDGSGSSDPDGTIISYDWDFGDGTIGSGVIAGHTYTAAGTYTVVLTVTDNDGATDRDTQDVTVPPSNMHVGDLDGSSAPAPRNRWVATVTITVHDESENPVANATVDGAWSAGASGGGFVRGRC